MDDSDIYEYSYLDTILYMALGTSFGLIGFVLVSIGSGLFVALLVYNPYVFLTVFLLSGALYGILAALRNWLVKRHFVNRNFVSAYDFRPIYQRGLNALSIIFFIAGGILFLMPRYLLLSSIPFGMFYLVGTPPIIVGRILTPKGEGRLSILQFLEEKDRTSPDFSWLRIGMRRVEDRLQTFGISIYRNVLLLGCTFALFKDNNHEEDFDRLLLLADWVAATTEYGGVYPPIKSFLTRADEAVASGFDRVRTPSERLSRLFRASGNSVVGIVLGAVLTAVIPFLIMFITSELQKLGWI